MLPVYTYPNYYLRSSYLPPIRALSYYPAIVPATTTTLVHPSVLASYDLENYLNAERLAALDLKHEIEDRIAEYKLKRFEHRLMHDECFKCKTYNDSGTCTELTIDEKIRALREELNLPPERDSTTANYKYCPCDHREIVTPDRPKILVPRSASRSRRLKMLPYPTSHYISVKPQFVAPAAHTVVPLVNYQVPLAATTTTTVPLTSYVPHVVLNPNLFTYDVTNQVSLQNYIDAEKLIDEKIKNRVQEQIDRYHSQEEQYKQLHDKVCKKEDTHSIGVNTDFVSTQDESASLDEKIRRIRQELNLDDEPQYDNHHYHCYHIHNDETNKNIPRVLLANKKYEIPEEYVEERKSRSRSRARSASRHTSRSKSAPQDRPRWVPTGSNDYTWTKETRAELLNGYHRQINDKVDRAKGLKTDQSTQANTMPEIRHYEVYYPQNETHNYKYKETIPVYKTKEKVSHYTNTETLPYSDFYSYKKYEPKTKTYTNVTISNVY